MSLLEDAVARSRASLVDPGDALVRLLELDAAQVGAERARLEGRDEPARWEALAASWLELGRPFRAAMARWRQAVAAESVGQRAAALEALAEAHHVASRLGARPLLVQLETMARRLRVRLGPTVQTLAPPSGPAFGLTPREREVLSAVAAGRTNRQIAEVLFISESTAGVHVSNILGKLGASTRTEAARIAMEQGLVERAV
jgi:DNA-binding CsgD family transcriptional regulator